MTCRVDTYRSLPHSLAEPSFSKRDCGRALQHTGAEPLWRMLSKVQRYHRTGGSHLSSATYKRTSGPGSSNSVLSKQLFERKWYIITSSPVCASVVEQCDSHSRTDVRPSFRALRCTHGDPHAAIARAAQSGTTHWKGRISTRPYTPGL